MTTVTVAFMVLSFLVVYGVFDSSEVCVIASYFRKTAQTPEER